MLSGNFWQRLPNDGVQILDYAAYVENGCVATQWLEEPNNSKVGGSLASVKQALARMIERSATSCHTNQSFWMCVSAETAARMYVVGLMHDFHLADARYVPGESVHLPCVQLTMSALDAAVKIVPQKAPLTLIIAPVGNFKER